MNKDKARAVMEKLPLDVHPRLGLGPTVDYIVAWYGTYAGDIREALQFIIERGDGANCIVPRNGVFKFKADEVHLPDEEKIIVVTGNLIAAHTRGNDTGE